MKKQGFNSSITGKNILITGGTGSFGGALVPKLLTCNAAEIRIFSRDEKKQDDMRKVIQDDRLKFCIGDIRDRDALSSATKSVDYVFHAAALKQVPSCEFYPLEAVKTNILGAENVINCSIANQVKKVVCLSTDKAVYPINAMGMSKAMMEKMAGAASRNCAPEKTVICVTRYGNVLGSRGSVVPHFFEQIKNKHPLTLTNENMTRFMMTLDQAVELVIYAFENGRSGDTFVQKAPAASIRTIVQAVKSIKNELDYPEKIIGIRHGEKMHESLTSAEEMLVAEDLGSYFRIPSDGRDLNYAKYFESGRLEVNFDETVGFCSDNTVQLSVEPTIELLKRAMGTLGQ